MRIYKIINLVNGKFYVGKDSTDNDNYWGSGILIRKAIKKYGIENFAREIIEYCNDLDELSEREKYWIKELDAIKYGYNIARGGEGGDTLSKNPRREEIIEKIRASNLGKKRTGQALDNIRNAIHKIDKAVMKMMIEKIVESRKRKRIERGHRTKKEVDADEIRAKHCKEKWTAEKRKEHSIKISKARSGMKFSEEHKHNIGKSSMGRIPYNRKIVIIDEIEYESLHAAASALGMPLNTVRNRIFNKNFPNFNYKEQPSQ